MAFSQKKIGWLIAISGTLTLLGMFLLEPIPQPQRYHCFADQKTIWSVPHFWNVISNLPFLVFSWIGFRRLRRTKVEHHACWMIFVVGVFLVGLGSSYYHLAPSNETLVWDRMPMTIGFMAAFCAIATEVLGPKMMKLMWPLILTGFASVCVWWAYDDLRFYAWVQFFPLIALAIILILARDQVKSPKLILWALAYYIAAKVFENWDRAIYNNLHELMSGHAIKHVLAALGTWELITRLKVLKIEAN